MVSKLKSLRELKAFDGEKEKLELHRDAPLPKCPHKDVRILNNEVRCKCGMAWRGENIHKLYSLITSN
jgi:hypothetical protein